MDEGASAALQDWLEQRAALHHLRYRAVLAAHLSTPQFAVHVILSGRGVDAGGTYVAVRGDVVLEAGGAAIAEILRQEGWFRDSSALSADRLSALVCAFLLPGHRAVLTVEDPYAGLASWTPPRVESEAGSDRRLTFWAIDLSTDFVQRWSITFPTDGSPQVASG